MANRISGKVLVIADSWPGLLVASDLSLLGIETKVFLAPQPLCPNPGIEAVFLGNGDPKERVLAVMGSELGERVFRVSEKNFTRAQTLFQELKVPTNNAGLDREGKQEPGMVFSVAELQIELEEKLGERIRRVDKVIQVERSKKEEYEVSASAAGGVTRQRADAVVIVSEYRVSKLIHSFHDKLIPVTLHAFEYASVPITNFALGFFHGGADYAMMGSNQALYGSYRNLFEDKGVGLIKEADPKTKAGIEAFFGGKGWLKGEGALRYSVESVTCDGLPIVGATSEMPGVYVVSGFAARKANFVFEVSRYVSNGIAKGQWGGDMEVFSTKRFV